MLCKKCNKNETQKPHPCPYETDVHDVDPEDKEKWCNCCKECQHECYRDI